MLVKIVILNGEKTAGYFIQRILCKCCAIRYVKTFEF